MTSVPTVPFHDGQQIPQLGLGVWQVEDDVAADVVCTVVGVGDGIGSGTCRPVSEELTA